MTFDHPRSRKVGFRFDPTPDFLAQRLDLGTRRATEIEQEIAMLFRHLGIAHGQPPAARGIDQGPGLVALRVLEGRAAGAAAQRLGFLAGAGDRVHFRSDGLGVAGLASEGRFNHDGTGRNFAVAIGIVELLQRPFDDFA